MIILNLSLCDSSSVLESLAVEEDDDVGWCRWCLASFSFLLVKKSQLAKNLTESSPLVATSRFLLFLLFVTLPWDSCFLLAEESFSSFLCLSWLTGVGLCSPLSLFSSTCTGIELSPESVSMIKICSGVQYGILIGLLQILKCRCLVYGNLRSFHTTQQNWKRRGPGS